MKQKKNTGALVVSLLLAAVLIGTYVGVAVKLGMMIHLAANGGVSMDAVQPMPNEVEALPDENIPADDVQTEAPAQTEGTVYPTRVELEKITDDDYNMYAKVTGYFEDGSLWQYYSPAYPVTELDPVEEIIDYEDTYIFCAGGKVIALDTMTGAEKWVNEDFNGYSPVWLSDAQRTICLSGFYGPDLHIVDADGNTIAHVEQMDEDYFWPIGVQKPDENTVTVIFSMGPEGEGNYPVDYDLTTGNVTTPFVPEAPGEEPMWVRGYRTLVDKEELSFAYDYALIYLDDDDVPELFLRGNEKSLLLSYDMENDEIYQMEIESYNIGYYPCSGVYIVSEYKDDRSEEAFYTYKDGRSQYQGTATMRHYDDKEPECWWNGEKLDINEFYKHVDELRPWNSVESYPNGYPKQMFLAQLDNWQNPSQNLYWDWKQEYLNFVRNNMNENEKFALVDVDGNGVPELFQYYETEHGAQAGVWMFDEQTQQYCYQYLPGTEIRYLPGEGIVVGTQRYREEYASDMVYQITAQRIVQVGIGERQLVGTPRETYHFSKDGYDFDELSAEAYQEALPVLSDPRAVLINDLLVSVEEIILQLK